MKAAIMPEGSVAPAEAALSPTVTRSLPSAGQTFSTADVALIVHTP